MDKIDPEIKIAELLRRYPETLDVFTANGFPAADRQSFLEAVGPHLSLKTALKVKEYNVRTFLGLLEDKIEEQRSLQALQSDLTAPERVDFLGYTYCPVKTIFKECFDETLQQYLAATGDEGFRYFVPSGCTGEEDPYEDLWKADNIDDFPDVAVAAGFGDFFRQEFVDRLVKPGYFKSIGYPRLNRNFISAGYEDPAGWYTMYSTQPTVMMVDRKRLGDLPVPARWSDLLDPVYKANIIIGGSPEEFYEDLLLYIYKDHGEQGLIKLAGNVKAGLHGSQMVKLAGSSNPQGAAVYVIPWLFARACPRTDDVMVIWPEDGALIMPMYLLAKAEPKRDLKPFLDFVLGERYGQKSADNGYPVLNPAVDNKLPDNAGFKWLGWDYIRSYSMEELYKRIMEIFNGAWQKGGL